MFARSFARVQQHILDDGVGAFPVLHDLVEIIAQGVCHSVISARVLSSPVIVPRASRSSSISSAETLEKLLIDLSCERGSQRSHCRSAASAAISAIVAGGVGRYERLPL